MARDIPEYHWSGSYKNIVSLFTACSPLWLAIYIILYSVNLTLLPSNTVNEYWWTVQKLPDAATRHDLRYLVDSGFQIRNQFFVGLLIGGSSVSNGFQGSFKEGADREVSRLCRTFSGLHRVSDELHEGLVRRRFQGSSEVLLGVKLHFRRFQRLLVGFTGSWVSFTRVLARFEGVSRRYKAYQGVLWHFKACH